MLFAHLSELAARFGGRAELMPVAPRRNNVLACWGEPTVTLSTHMDTVPPFYPSREDDEHIWGRGACDTKGIIAAMIFAVSELLEAGERNIGLLFVVDEERNSAGARAAAQDPRGSKFIINGEPTENKLALGSKGALRFELVASGRMAHSAYPELGESAIEKLLDALQEIRRVPLPVDQILGASTLNIGTIAGGRARNIIPDHAQAELFIRLVDDGEATRARIRKAVEGKAEIRDVRIIPAVHLGSPLPGFETTIVSLHHGRSRFCAVPGAAVLDRPWLDPPGAHRGGTDSQRRNSGSNTNLQENGQAAQHERKQDPDRNIRRHRNGWAALREVSAESSVV